MMGTGRAARFRAEQLVGFLGAMRGRARRQARPESSRTGDLILRHSAGRSGRCGKPTISEWSATGNSENLGATVFLLSAGRRRGLEPIVAPNDQRGAPYGMVWGANRSGTEVGSGDATTHNAKQLVARNGIPFCRKSHRAWER